MKRQKRNRELRAYHKGYQAGLNGRSQDICPHEQAPCKTEWMLGWHEGRSDQWHGLNGIAGLPKLMQQMQHQ